MKNRNLYFITAITILLFSCNHATNEVVVFDARNNYPVLDLKLSDIADVEYIKLNHLQEDILLRKIDNEGRALFITDEKIFLVDTRRLFVYDRTGNLIFHIDREGRGPGEYVMGFQLLVDTTQQKILLFNPPLAKFLIYDFHGSQIAEIFRGEPIYASATGMIGDQILFYNETINDFTMAIVDPTEGIIKPFKLNYSLPKIFDPEGYLGYSQLIDAPGGKFVFTFRSDTLYFISNDLDIRPRFVNKSYNMSSTTLYPPHLYPTMETDKYVFFVSIFAPSLHPEERLKYYVYDKSKMQFFRLKQLNGKDKYINSYYWEPLLHNSPEFIWSMITMNDNYMGSLLAAEYLVEHKNELPEPLKQIASTLDEYDNPILMLIKFR